MNEKMDEKTTIIKLRVSERLVTLMGILALALALLLFLALTADDAVVTAGDTSVAQPSGMRQFYLSEYSYDGDVALAQCAAGYHMASLWEIADPTNLKYNTSLGRAAADSGQGPPSDKEGWVRTGYLSYSSDLVGRANCTTWSDLDGLGTVVNLVDYWTGGGQDMDVWDTGTAGCELSRSVWCVED